MKNKHFVILAFIIFIGSHKTVEAQRAYSGGDRTFEIMMSPFSDTPVSFNQFRFRLFRDYDMALRFRGDLQYSSIQFSQESRDTELDLTLAPGLEIHAFQDDRISVYYGAEIAVSYLTTREHRTDFDDEEYTNKNTEGNEHFGLGLNGIAGLDVKFLRWLYAGVEVGYGISRVSYLDEMQDEEVFENDSVDFIFGQFTSSLFRLGVEF